MCARVRECVPKKLQPGLKLLTWTDFYGNEAKLKNKGISVIER